MQSPLSIQHNLDSSLSVQNIFNVAQKYHKIGRFNQSLRLAYNASQKDPDLQQQYQKHYLETVKLGAEFAEEIGNHHQAAYYWKKLVEYQPNNVLAWHGLGIAKANLNDFSSAQQALTKCLQLQPDNPKVSSQLQEIQQLVHR